MNAPTIDNWTYETLVTTPAPIASSSSSRAAARPRPRTCSTSSRIITTASSRTRTSASSSAWSTTSSATPDPARRCIRASTIVRHVADSEIGLDSTRSRPAYRRRRFDRRPVAGGDLRPGCDAHPLPRRALPRARRRPGALRRGAAAMMNERFPNLPRAPHQALAGPRQRGRRRQGSRAELDAADPTSRARRGGARAGRRLQRNRHAAQRRRQGAHGLPRARHSSLLISPRCKLYIAGRPGNTASSKKPESARNEYEDQPEKAHPGRTCRTPGSTPSSASAARRHVMNLLQQQRKAAAAAGQAWAARLKA
jgi:hypothetical protein